jgi:hypothetical protein
MREGQHDLGRILEAMLYYDRVHLMMSAQMFLGLWDILGPDDFGALLAHPTITTTLTPQMLGIKNEIRNGIVTHRPVAFQLSGRDGGQMIRNNDDVGILVAHSQNLLNRPGATRPQITKLLKLTKPSRYAKMLGGEAASAERIISLAKDQETLKLFLRGWAVANGQTANEAAIQAAQISVIDVGEEFMFASTVPLEQMVTGWNPAQNWGEILASLQDYAVDLYLSDAHSADIITAPEIGAVASRRIDLSIQRALRNQTQISAFEEMVFDEARGFADAYNDGLITFSEALKVIDKSRRFRTWTKGLAPDADLIVEYHRAVTKDTILKSLPASIARFVVFNGAGMLADTVATGTGLISSAIDNFVVERLIGGWKPNIFVRNVKKLLDKAERRFAERST